MRFVRKGCLRALETACFAFLIGFAPLGAGADTVFIETGEDTSPYSFVPSLARFNNPTLYAFDAEDESGSNHRFETYLRFDVSAADLPPGHVVSEALLVVTYSFDFVGFGSTSTEPAILHAHRVTGSWNETTLTWNTRPSIDAPFDSVTQIVGFGALIFDTTTLVQEWVEGISANHGVALTSPTERVMGMHSFEAQVDPSLKPFLLLTTEVPEPGLAASLALGVVVLRAFTRKRRVRA